MDPASRPQGGRRRAREGKRPRRAEHSHRCCLVALQGAGCCRFARARRTARSARRPVHARRKLPPRMLKPAPVLR
jgi:hypothetical protein